jgi:hypothetical protein
MPKSSATADFTFLPTAFSVKLTFSVSVPGGRTVEKRLSVQPNAVQPNGLLVGCASFTLWLDSRI